MDPIDDPKLSEILKEWQLPGAPNSLDQRVLGQRKRWWNFLLTGSIRLPVPVVVAIAAALLVMAVALIRQRPASPTTAPVNLADFRPVSDLNVRIIRGHDDAR
jgi:hypothetical protein